MAIQEAIRLRSKRVVATLAAAAIGLILIAHGCSERKDGAATKVETAGDAGAGAESQSAEFSLSAKDDEGFDLPEREEIRQKRKLAPETKVFVIGYKDAKVDSDGKEVIVMGINGPVKVEAADTDIAEVLVVRSARKREDLQSQKVEISDNEGLYIQVGSAEAPAPVHEVRKRLERVGKRLPETAPSPEPASEIHLRVVLRLPRKANLEIREIGGGVTIGEVGGHLRIAEVTGNVRAARVAGSVEVSEVNGAIDMTFAPFMSTSIKMGDDINGNVDLCFEGGVNADLTAWNVIGAIKPDFPNMEISRTERGWWWASLKARIGNGGSLIEVHNVRGNVKLSKAGTANASALKAAAK